MTERGKEKREQIAKIIRKYFDCGTLTYQGEAEKIADQILSLDTPKEQVTPHAGRLLTDKEIKNEAHYEYENEKHDANLTECYTHLAVKRLVEAQDAKTYPLAFAAGVESMSDSLIALRHDKEDLTKRLQTQKKKNQQEIERLTKQNKLVKDDVGFLSKELKDYEDANVALGRKVEALSNALSEAKKQGAREFIKAYEYDYKLHTGAEPTSDWYLMLKLKYL